MDSNSGFDMSQRGRVCRAHEKARKVIMLHGGQESKVNVGSRIDSHRPNDEANAIAYQAELIAGLAEIVDRLAGER